MAVQENISRRRPRRKRLRADAVTFVWGLSGSAGGNETPAARAPFQTTAEELVAGCPGGGGNGWSGRGPFWSAAIHRRFGPCLCVARKKQIKSQSGDESPHSKALWSAAIHRRFGSSFLRAENP